MRKIIFLTLIVFALFLTACNKSEKITLDTSVIEQVGSNAEMNGVEMNLYDYDADTGEVTVKWLNDTNEALHFGEHFMLHTYEDGEWQPAAGSSLFTDLLFVVEAGTSHEHIYKTINFTDTMSAGKYKITTGFSTKDNTDKVYSLDVEFEIK